MGIRAHVLHRYLNLKAPVVPAAAKTCIAHSTLIYMSSLASSNLLSLFRHLFGGERRMLRRVMVRV